MIRQQAAGESFSRGQQDERRGAVLSMVLRGDLLQAQVEGSGPEPNRVRVTFGPQGVVSARCSCPYDWGGWCQHIVAALLTAAHQPDTVELRPPLADLLAGMDADELRDVLLRVASRDSEVADAVELQISLVRAATLPPPSALSPAEPVDAEGIRRQVRVLLRAPRRPRYSAEDDYDEETFAQLDEVIQQARTFSEAGDGRGAIAILNVLTEESLAHLEALDGPAFEPFLAELDAAWAEALLSTPLTEDERAGYVARIEQWNAEMADAEMSEALVMALAAARQGWDSPALKRALAGQIGPNGIWDGPPPDYADELAGIRLAILARQGRGQEYLYLAEAEGQTDSYLTMLVELGRIEQAVTDGLRHLATASDALALAQALEAADQPAAALRIGEHGLKLAGPVHPLAGWLSEAAERAGQAQLARRAAEAAFRAAPSLPAYLRLRAAAGPAWPQLRDGIIGMLRRDGQRGQLQAAAVDIFLHEKLYDDAIWIVRGNAVDVGLLERVMDAVLMRKPSWVLQEAASRAEHLLESGDPRGYERAATWLRRTRDAYRAMGRPSGWHAYMKELRRRYARKYKVIELLETI